MSLEAGPNELEKAERSLRRAIELMAFPVHGAGHDWLLLATLIGEAGLVVQERQRLNSAFEMPLLDQAVEELREISKDFSDPAFLRSTRPARRRNPELFSPRA